MVDRLKPYENLEDSVFECTHKTTNILIALAISALAAVSPLLAGSDVDSHTPDQQRLDSIQRSLPQIEQKVYSTLLFGGSSPVSITGEARLKGTDHIFTQCPAFLGPHLASEVSADSVDGDRSALVSSGGIRLGIVVQPTRNLCLWSKLGVSSKFAGMRVRKMDSTGSFSLAQAHYYEYNTVPVALFEDMCAGAAYMTSDVCVWLKLGSIIWTEASPLTIWKAEPRAFAWEYLEYEDEQPSSEYYKSNVEIGEKTGRAAWNKKAFNGINLEGTTLPFGFYFNFLYAKFSDFDDFEREFMDFSSDLGYAAEENNTLITETGYGDSYRHYLHFRLANTFNDLTLGVNYGGMEVSKDIIYAQNPSSIYFNSMFSLEYKNSKNFIWADQYHYVKNSSGQVTDSVPLDCGKGFFKSPQVASIDFKGNLNKQVFIHADVGFSRIDTTWIWGDTVPTSRENIPLTIQRTGQTFSPLVPAVYTSVGLDLSQINITTDLVYAKKGFYAPFSFINPMDAFFAFGTNCVGEGTFSAKTEASPYAQNMAGALLSFSPKFGGSGHFIVKYGQHFQPEPGRDLLFFPYRLHGMDLNASITSSYNMDGLGTVDYPMTGAKYDRRLGDESYDPNLDVNGNANDFPHIDESPEKGGLHADYLSMFEAFVPYDDPKQVLLNIASRKGKIQRDRTVDASDNIGRVIQDNGDTVTVTNPQAASDPNGFVPTSKKYTGNLDVDVAYDIGPYIGYRHKCYLAGYASISGVTNAFKMLAVSENSDDVLLWSSYVRFEPAIALTDKFYLDVLWGVENWRSNKAWMNMAVYTNDDAPDPSVVGKENLDAPLIKRMPINYKDVAYGIGFDWDMMTRTSLHYRLKYMTHTDQSCSPNNYAEYLSSLEITMFF